MGSKNESPEKVTLKRDMGLFGGIGIIAGIVVGSGIFYLGSYVLQRTNMNMGLALLCWIVGGVVSILGGLCFAELGACDPAAGGMVVYLDKAYHPVVGYMFGFTSWLLSGAGSLAAVAIALPTTLQSYFSFSEWTIKIIAILLIIALTAYNCFGIKAGAILQNVSLVAKLIPIVLIIAGALIMGDQNPDLSIIPQGGFEGGIGGAIRTIAFATVATLWAYEGWTNVNSVAEEIKKPEKNLPRALIFGIGSITILYALFNLAIYKVLPYDEVVSMINSDNLYLGTEVAKRVFGSLGGALVLAAMLIAMFGSLNGMIISFARYYYAMAVEGHFFKSQAKLSPKYQVPTNALIWQAIISIILVLLRNLDQLTSLVVFSGMVFNTLVVIAVIIYRKKFPNMERPYKAWGYPVTVVLSVILFAALMLNTLIEDPLTSIIGLVVPAIGAVVYFIFDAKLKKERQA
ncbi:MAG: amino acid permease [Dysosmobacter sp.]|jgi:APA family basic amino acid/polyamine antiporter|uniref:APC family permease n=1 Tax=Dysosmobacter sp. TaxID=2591382 RepID=UPI002847F893|nr:amino acid permease [Dysosmobacter sp.]MDR3982180.1 amino acid permease [Dysosmobacter sp.]